MNAKQWLFLRGGFMRPVSNFFMIVNRTLFGTNATGYFISTIVFHSITVFIVYFLVKELVYIFLKLNHAPAIAFTTAILFLFYPFHAESLMWVIGQGSIIAAMFALLSILFFIKATHRSLFLFFSWVCFVIALYTYESIWNLPLVYFVIAWGLYRGRRVQFLRATGMSILMFITFVVFLISRIYFLGTIAGDGYLEVNENMHHPLFLFSNFCKLVARNFTPPINRPGIFVLLAIAVASLFAFLFVRLFKKNKINAVFSLLVLAGMITAVLPALPLGIDTHYNEGDRYLYYSSFFLCFFIALMLTALPDKRVVTTVVIVLVIVFTGFFLPLQSNYAYASTVTRTTIKVLRANKGYKNAYFIDVPNKYQGALIFRVGLDKAIEWLVAPGAFDSVVVLSQSNFTTKSASFEYHTCNIKDCYKYKASLLTDSTLAIDRHFYHCEDCIFFYFRPDGIYRVLP